MIEVDEVEGVTKNAKDSARDPFEVIEQDQQKRRHKGVYLLPNLFTTAALFSGFYALVSAMNEAYVWAAVAILVAGIFDAMDGGVARLTNTQSKFGAEYDSLSDCVAFGVAPGLVAYAYGLQDLGRIGWVVAFVYVACAALRLARFNVDVETADHRYFTGLPSPTAAILVATAVWFSASGGAIPDWMLAVITAAAGLLMMSSFRYHSFKELHVGRVPFRVLLVVIVAFVAVSLNPPLVLLVVGVIYTLSGPLMKLPLLRKLENRV